MEQIKIKDIIFWREQSIKDDIAWIGVHGYMKDVERLGAYKAGLENGFNNAIKALVDNRMIERLI